MVIFVLVVLLLYLVLPLVMESLIAWRLQTAFGTPTKPDVEVSSNFPPMMLLGLYNARADLKGVNVPVSNLIAGNPIIETQSCSVSVDTPPVLINQNQACLSYLGLGAVY